MPNHHHIQRTKKRATTIAAVDRISDLPGPILHHILSFLPHTDVIRTRLLSKTFLSVFTSFPVIDLDSDLIEFYGTRPVSSKREKMVAFVNYVDYSVQRLKIDTDLQKFRLRANISDRNLAHRILKHIDFAIKNRVKELDIEFVSHFYSLPQTISSANFIKTLNLSGTRLINLSDLRFNSWWPNLESLSISRCNGFKDFNFSSGKIRSISLESCKGLNSVKVESSSLESFTFSGSDLRPCKIDVSECMFIKVLSIGNVSVRDNWVEDNVPKFLNLEFLKLVKLSPKSRQLLKISSANLQKLELEKMHGITEIQAPNLESFQYRGARNDSVNIRDCFPLKILSWESITVPNDFLKDQISNMGGLKSLKIEFTQRCTLKKFKIIHRNGSKLVPPFAEMVQVRLKFPAIVSVDTVSHCLPRGFMSSEDVFDVMLSIDFIDNKDFVTFWNWIASFAHVKVLTIVCNSVKDMAYSKTEGLELLTPISDLKHLTIKQLTWRSITPDLVNSFLCQSPNLETLHFASAKGIERSMEFVYGSRTGRADNLSPSCCRCLSIQCWRHSLEKVVLKNFDGVERDELTKYFRENAVMLVKIWYVATKAFLGQRGLVRCFLL